MNVRGEDIETALNCWHPEQWVNLYDSFSGVYCSTAQIKDIDLDEDDDADFAEPVDKNGQPMKPRLK